MQNWLTFSGGFALPPTSSKLRLNRIIFCRIQFYFHPVHILKRKAFASGPDTSPYRISTQRFILRLIPRCSITNKTIRTSDNNEPHISPYHSNPIWFTFSTINLTSEKFIFSTIQFRKSHSYFAPCCFYEILSYYSSQSQKRSVPHFGTDLLR